MATHAPLPEQAAALAAELEQRVIPYLALDELGGDQARLRFVGRYRGEAVVWDAQLVALLDERHAQLRPRGAASQFMDIGAPGQNGIPIQIGLAVSCIDAPVAHKAVIMVQNYKRLQAGRYEFGPSNSAP